MKLILPFLGLAIASCQTAEESEMVRAYRLFDEAFRQHYASLENAE